LLQVVAQDHGVLLLSSVQIKSTAFTGHPEIIA
jgi:hypothetical protein